MLKRAGLSLSALALAALLLLNFHGPEDVATVSSGDVSGASSSGASTSNARSNSGLTQGSAPGSSPAASPRTASGTATYAGGLVQTPYGDVQVQIVVGEGRITDVRALALPTGGHSGRISRFVEPILRSQALAAQSASIDGISGATFTSRAYARSLQSALDAAGL